MYIYFMARKAKDTVITILLFLFSAAAAFCAVVWLALSWILGSGPDDYEAAADPWSAGEQFNREIAYGSLVYEGQAYRTVKIGTQVWMAENLNFKTERSVCYGNADSNCTKYGRLYDWDEAMKACPDGWRAPGDEDWDRLAAAVGGRRAEDEDGDERAEDEDRDRWYIGDYWDTAGEKLRSKIGWYFFRSTRGTDEFGFSALPGGFRDADGSFDNVHFNGCWWSATEYDASYAWFRYMDFYSGGVQKYGDYKMSMFSLRCLQGSADLRQRRTAAVH